MKLTKEAYWLSRNPRAEIDLHNRIQALHAHALANSNLLLPDPRSSARVAAFHILANRLDRKYQRVLFKALRPVVIDPLLAHIPVDEDISVSSSAPELPELRLAVPLPFLVKHPDGGPGIVGGQHVMIRPRDEPTCIRGSLCFIGSRD